MPKRFTKTAQGRQEIRERRHALGRTARNLLLILDAHRSAPEWLDMVQGASEADFEVLLTAGLIEEVLAPAAAPTPGQGELAGKSARSPEETVAAVLDFESLYSQLTAQVKAQLGLVKGYRYALDIERASNMNELQALAERLVAEVTESKGSDAGRKLRRVFQLAD